MRDGSNWQYTSEVPPGERGVWVGVGEVGEGRRDRGPGTAALVESVAFYKKNIVTIILLSSVHIQ